VYALFVCPAIVVLQELSLYHWYVNVVPPGSLTSAVNVIVLHSFALHATSLAVGETFFHVAVFTALHVPLHCASVTFTYTLFVHGSVNVFLYVLDVALLIALVHVEFVYHWYVNVDHSSLAVAVYVISSFSFFGPLLLTLTVGATFFHIAFVLTHVLVAPFASVTFKLTV